MTTPTNGSLLRQRMIEDMVARRMVPGTQVGHKGREFRMVRELVAIQSEEHVRVTWIERARS